MAGISGSLSDIDAIEREMFDDYNGEGPKHKAEEEFYGEMLDGELLIEDYEPDLSDEDAKPATMSECSMFLVQHMIDDELFSSLMTPQRLIDYINMDDCHGESFFNTFICVICIFNSNQFIAMLFGIVAFSFVVFFLFFELFFTAEIFHSFVVLYAVIFN